MRASSSRQLTAIVTKGRETGAIDQDLPRRMREEQAAQAGRPALASGTPALRGTRAAACADDERRDRGKRDLTCCRAMRPARAERAPSTRVRGAAAAPRGLDGVRRARII